MLSFGEQLKLLQKQGLKRKGRPTSEDSQDEDDEHIASGKKKPPKQSQNEERRRPTDTKNGPLRAEFAGTGNVKVMKHSGKQSPVTKAPRVDQQKGGKKQPRSSDTAAGTDAGTDPFFEPSRPVSKPEKKQRPNRDDKSGDEPEDSEDENSSSGEDDGPSSGNASKQGDASKKAKNTKKDKSRPAELSSKRAVGRARQVVNPSEWKPRDPRFDERTGQLNAGLFESSYGFVFGMQQQEMSELRQKIAKEKDPDERKKLEKLLTGMQSKMKARKATEDRQKIKRDWRKKQAERVKQGKKPFFLKDSDIKRIQLMEKFKDSDSKDLDKVLEKRRKKNATKDHRKMPFARA